MLHNGLYERSSLPCMNAGLWMPRRAKSGQSGKTKWVQISECVTQRPPLSKKPADSVCGQEFRCTYGTRQPLQSIML